MKCVSGEIPIAVGEIMVCHSYIHRVGFIDTLTNSNYSQKLGLQVNSFKNLLG